MSETRVRGFYWVKVGTREPEIMRFEPWPEPDGTDHWYMDRQRRVLRSR